MKIIDQHVHTEFSIDSRVDLEDYFKHAESLGLSHVSFTDHVDYDSLDYGGLDVEVDYEGIRSKGERLQEMYDVKLNLGVEVGYRIDLEHHIKNYLQNKEYGVILFSVHQDRNGHYATDSRTDKERVKAYFQALNEMLDSDFDYDIVTHIDYVFRYLKVKDCYAKYQSEYEGILKKIIKKEVVLEINSKTALILGDFGFVDFILSLYSKLGGKYIALGSDCHQLKRYQDGFEEIISLMKKYHFEFVTEIIDREKRLKKI